MSPAKSAPLVVNGWSIFAHPLFLDQLEALIRQVETGEEKEPEGLSRQERHQAPRSDCEAGVPGNPGRPYTAGVSPGQDARRGTPSLILSLSCAEQGDYLRLG